MRVDVNGVLGSIGGTVLLQSEKKRMDEGLCSTKYAPVQKVAIVDHQPKGGVHPLPADIGHPVDLQDGGAVGQVEVGHQVKDRA